MSSRVHLSSELREITTEIFTTASAIIGIRGSGKTNDGVVLAEERGTLGVPFAVIDPTGSGGDSSRRPTAKSAGLPFYVFGGQHGDVPLEATAGPVLAQFIVENARAGHPRPLRPDEGQAAPVRRPVPGLAVSPQERDVASRCSSSSTKRSGSSRSSRAARTPISNECIGAVEDIVQLGRSRGLGCAIIGPRPAIINKNVLTHVRQPLRDAHGRDAGPQGDRRVGHRGAGRPDGSATSSCRTSPSLKQGEGYFWSPAIFGVFKRTQFAKRTTFDQRRTPKIGEKRHRAARLREGRPGRALGRDRGDRRARQSRRPEGAARDDRRPPEEARREGRGRSRRGGAAARPHRRARVPAGHAIEVSVLTDADRALLHRAVGEVQDALGTAKGELLGAAGGFERAWHRSSRRSHGRPWPFPRVLSPWRGRSARCRLQWLRAVRRLHGP